MKIIAGADFMKFENLNPEDLQDIFKAAPPMRSQTNLTLEEMMSVASHVVSIANVADPMLEKSHNSSEYKDLSDEA